MSTDCDITDIMTARLLRTERTARDWAAKTIQASRGDIEEPDAYTAEVVEMFLEGERQAILERLAQRARPK
jgi:hypothetical protein